MATLPGGKVVTHKIPDQKHAPSPLDRDNPRAQKAAGKPYQAAKPQVNNYAAREAELKAHHEALRTDLVTGKKY
jgi:hypothetical protein